MHALTVDFHTVSNPHAQDSIVFAAALDLFINHGVCCAQTSECTLEFESHNSRSFAMLILEHYPQFTTVIRD